jgi:hypothetical protein
VAKSLTPLSARRRAGSICSWFWLGVRDTPAASFARQGDELSFSTMAKVFSSLFWWPEFYYLLRERNSRSLEFNGLAFHENLLGSLQLPHEPYTLCLKGLVLVVLFTTNAFNCFISKDKRFLLKIKQERWYVL